MKEKLKYFIAVILIILFTFSIVPKSFQNDTFYIIELGKQILQNGVDWIDHCSIHQNLEYRYPHWAFDVLNFKIYDLFGFNGIYLFTQIFASIFVLLVFWTLLKREVNFNLSFLGTLIVAYMMRETFCARGQIVSYSLFFLEYILLENFVERPTLFKTLGLFALSCIMANVHSTAWIMMLVLLLPFIGEQIIYNYTLKGINERKLKKYNKKLEKNTKLSEDKVKKIKNEIEIREKFQERHELDKTDHKIIIEEKPNIKWIWVAFVALVLGALITPIKLTPILYFLKTSMGDSMNYIDEHTPIIIAGSLEFFTYTVIIVALIGFTKVKLRLSDALLLLGLYLMTISGKRNLYLLIALTSVIIIKLIDDFMKSNKTKENKKNLKIFFVVISIASLLISMYMFIRKMNDEYILKAKYPVEATKYIKEKLDYKNIRLYNRYDYGSYLLMEGIPVFIDSRCDLYTPEFNKGVTVLDDYMEVFSQKMSISALMDKYDLDYAIVPVGKGEQVYMNEDNRFIELYKDKYFAVYRYEGK